MSKRYLADGRMRQLVRMCVWSIAFVSIGLNSLAQKEIVLKTTSAVSNNATSEQALIKIDDSFFLSVWKEQGSALIKGRVGELNSNNSTISFGATSTLASNTESGVLHVQILDNTLAVLFYQKQGDGYCKFLDIEATTQSKSVVAVANSEIVFSSNDLYTAGSGANIATYSADKDELIGYCVVNGVSDIENVLFSVRNVGGTLTYSHILDLNSKQKEVFLAGLNLEYIYAGDFDSEGYCSVVDYSSYQIKNMSATNSLSRFLLADFGDEIVTYSDGVLNWHTKNGSTDLGTSIKSTTHTYAADRIALEYKSNFGYVLYEENINQNSDDDVYIENFVVPYTNGNFTYASSKTVVANGRFDDHQFVVLGGHILVSMIDEATNDVGFYVCKCVNTWRGDGNWWTATENWSDDVIPSINDDVVIASGTVTVTDHTVDETTYKTQVNDFTIKVGANVVVSPRNSLTVNGTLKNEAGINGLKIISIIDNVIQEGQSVQQISTGSLICDTENVEATFNHYINNINEQGEDERPVFWHSISSPVSGCMAAADVFMNQYLTTHNEVDNSWGYLVVGDSIECGKGYMVSTRETSKQLTFAGVMNAGETQVSTVYSNASTTLGNGWNFIGNPYPATINWESQYGITLQNVGTGIYVYDPKKKLYASYNNGVSNLDQTQYIAPLQGFFVRNEAFGSGKVIFTDDAKCNEVVYFKSASISLVRLAAQNSHNTDETVVAIRPESTRNFDSRYDAYKLFTTSNTPQLFSQLDDVKYSINCVPPEEDSVIVNVGVKSNVADSYTLRMTEERMIDYDEITLEDANGVRIDLRSEEYTATLRADSVAMFRLIIHNTITTDTPFEDDEQGVYSRNGNIYIQGKKRGYVSCYNQQGRLVANRRFTPNSMVISVRSKGVYIVRIDCGDGEVSTYKIVV